MQDRFKFRAFITVSYYLNEEDDEEKNISFFVYPNGIYTDGSIGVIWDNIYTAVNKLDLEDFEKKAILDRIDDEEHDDDWFVLYPYDINQCTGLKDKNGNIIYDGDIVENDEDKKFVIEWCDDKLGFLARTDNPNEILESLDIYYTSWKIIGNIHENADLLKGFKNED